ncbi:MAG: redoxin family protein [Wenzhouxiangella sp.]
MTIKTGDAIPSAQLTISGPNGPTPVDARELLGSGKVVLFAVPGAYTPTCSVQHLPSFIEHREALMARGVQRIVCMAVNDIFVLQAWAKSAGASDQIVMAADGNGELTRALGLVMDARAFGMGERSQRFALIANDGVVEQVFVEAPGEYRVSSAEYVLERLG